MESEEQVVARQPRKLEDRKVSCSTQPLSANYTTLGWGDPAAFGKGSRVGRSRVLGPKLGNR